jgi:superfamily II DNA/RNA helicase
MPSPSDSLKFEDDAEVKVEGVKEKEKLCWEKWNDMELEDKLMKNIKYIRPRKVQQVVIPYITEGYDIKCQSETGTGKTAAFLIPIIDNLMKDKSPKIPNAPYCIILAPTRELIAQIHEQAKELTQDTDIRVIKTYGEIPTKTSIGQLAKGCHILCTCVGRLIHFIEKGHIFLDNVNYLVIDEADQFFIGNESQGILKFLRNKTLPSVENRQTMMFSATLRIKKTKKKANEFFDPKKEVTIISKATTNQRIVYVVEAVPEGKSKIDFLIEYARKIIAKHNWQCPRMMIFANKKKTADEIEKALNNAKWATVSTHSDYPQDLRDKTLQDFRDGDIKSRILVSIVVCGRGIDVHDMDYVINYDIPNSEPIFIQRCGRTGRVQRGTAITFYVEAEDSQKGAMVKKVIQEAGQVVPKCLENISTTNHLNTAMNQLNLGN